MSYFPYSESEIVRYGDLLWFRTSEPNPEGRVMLWRQEGIGGAISIAPYSECEHIAINEAALMVGYKGLELDKGDSTE